MSQNQEVLLAGILAALRLCGRKEPALPFRVAPTSQPFAGIDVRNYMIMDSTNWFYGQVESRAEADAVVVALNAALGA